MTEELFREDSYVRGFDACITLIHHDRIILDRTAFYPLGGGQPGDTGTIKFSSGEEVKVADTRKDESGSLAHYLESVPENLAPGDSVVGQLDWQRRFRFMRAHTCMHLLCSLVPYDVTGGSIGDGRARLDFDMEEGVDKEVLQRGLDQLIAGDHPVSYRWISDAEMEQNLDLVRTMSVKPPMGQGRVRLVEIDGVDLQPCGGTHLARTGEVGVVKIGKVEKKGRHNRRINLVVEV